MLFPLTSLDGLLITSTLLSFDSKHLMIVQDFNYPETFFFSSSDKQEAINFPSTHDFSYFFSSSGHRLSDVPCELVVVITRTFVFHFQLSLLRFHCDTRSSRIFLIKIRRRYEKCFTWEIPFPLFFQRSSKFHSLINFMKFSFN